MYMCMADCAVLRSAALCMTRCCHPVKVQTMGCHAASAADQHQARKQEHSRWMLAAVLPLQGQASRDRDNSHFTVKQVQMRDQWRDTRSRKAVRPGAS